MLRRFVTGGIVGILLAGSATALEIKPQEVIDRYRRVLTLLSSGERDQAMAALYDLETRAIGDGIGTVELQRFWRLKLKVVREVLQAGELDQLIPIIVLHHDAYLMYREKGQPFLAGHARTMAAELAETLAKKDHDPQVREFSSWVLTSFAVYMQENRSVSSSAAFLQTALDFAPDNHLAMLALGAAHEKYGEYEAATGVLQREVELNADDYEARLRLAICQRRLGQREAPVRHLKKLVEAGPPEWIRTLAFEELARIYREDGTPEMAQALLERGLTELPNEQQLRIQAAAYLDLDRRPREASQLLDGLRDAGEGASSPRYKYDRWPHDGVEEVRGSMRAMMDSHLGELAAGLRSVPATGVGS